MVDGGKLSILSNKKLISGKPKKEYSHTGEFQVDGGSTKIPSVVSRSQKGFLWSCDWSFGHQ